MKGKFFLLFVLIFLFVLTLPLAKKPKTDVYTPSLQKSETFVKPGSAEEILKIKQTTNLSEQALLYKKLIHRVGPEEAQEELLASGLPFDGQTHLLNHTVGEFLYQTYKTQGLVHCRDYFLSSCYHGFVIDAVADGGFDTLEKVMATCWKSGPTVAVQCSHAIGHGFLAYDGYANLIKALSDCDEMANRSKNFPIYNCHDGVFMENIWAVHESGKPSKDRWISDSDPVYPCNDSRLEYRYIKACWSNQPMQMYRMFGQDAGRVGIECNKLTDLVHKEICFDGLARQIHPVTRGSVSETFRLCGQMPKEWYYSCVNSIVRAAFGVGDRVVPFQLCKEIDEGGKPSCYSSLIGIVKAYYPLEKDQKTWCEKISDPRWKTSCPR